VVDPVKGMLLEKGFDFFKAAGDEVFASVEEVHPGKIAVGFKIEDLVKGNEVKPSLSGQGYFLMIGLLGIAAEIVAQGAKLAFVGLLVCQFFHSGNGFLKFIGINRFFQKIHGTQTESLDSVLAEGGDKYHMETKRPKGLQQFNARQMGHLDIEENQVHGMGAEPAEGFPAVVKLMNDLHLRAMTGQVGAENIEAVDFVVDEDGVHFLEEGAEEKYRSLCGDFLYLGRLLFGGFRGSD